jgi:hypothetical protein
MSLLSSKALLLWLVGAWAVYYVTLAVWSREALASFTVSLKDNIVFQALYVLFVLSAALNLGRAMRERAARGRAACALWAVLPAGVIVFLAGFFLSILFRQFEWVLVGRGDAVRPAWQDDVYEAVEVKPALADEVLDMEGSGASSLFAYEPKVVLRAGGELHEVGVFPPRRVGGSYYHILNFGMAPGVRLAEGGEVASEGFMALRILPPGADDVFTVKPYPYTFRLRLAPSKVLEKGRAEAMLYNLREPIYDVAVEADGVEVFRGRSDEGVEFGGLSLSFTRPDYWVMVEAAKDPGLPLLALGVCLITLGLPLSAALAVKRLITARRAGDK